VMRFGSPCAMSIVRTVSGGSSFVSGFDLGRLGGVFLGKSGNARAENRAEDGDQNEPAGKRSPGRRSELGSGGEAHVG